MLVNMPAYNGTLTSSNQLATDNQHHGTNLLKRKHIDELEHNLGDNLNRNDATDLDTRRHQLPLDNLGKPSNWKKRHIIQTQNNEDHYSSSNFHSDNDVNSYGLNANLPVISTTETTESSGSTTNGMYNVISNSGFIGDFLSYDSSLVATPITTQNHLNAELLLACDEPIFSTPTASTTCIQSTETIDNETDDWQAGDLLELDHRYNSNLQTEITQLNPTVKLKSTELTDIQKTHDSNANLNGQQQQQQQLQQATDDNFLMPIIRSESSAQNQRTTSGWTTYRSRNSSAVITHNDNETDFEDKNLSWLLNFKFDEFPHLSPDLSKSTKQRLTANENPDACLTNENQNGNTNTIIYGLTSSSNVFNNNVGTPIAIKSMALPMITVNNCGARSSREHSNQSPKQFSKTSRKFEELVMEVTTESNGDDMPISEHSNTTIDEPIYQNLKKPPFTYTELIEYALEDKGELTVSGIYQWISDRFPYYKSNDDRWKNSVRHNLSINPHFRKGIKAPQGAGHLWTISSGDSAENVLAWEHKKQRLDLFFKMEAMNRERLQQQRLQHNEQQHQEQRTQQQQQQQQRHSKHFNGSGEHQMYQEGYDEAAVAAAIIQDEMLHHPNGESRNSDAITTSTYQLSSQSNEADMDSDAHNVNAYNDLMNDEELRKTAGQILNGIHRDVEVQSVNHASIISTYQDVLLDNEDYITPIENSVVAVSESSLTHAVSSAKASSANCIKISSAKDSNSNATTNATYYVNEIDTMDLALHMTAHSQSGTTGVENLVTEDASTALFHDEFNMNYFGYAAINANDAIS